MRLRVLNPLKRWRYAFDKIGFMIKLKISWLDCHSQCHMAKLQEANIWYTAQYPSNKEYQQKIVYYRTRFNI